MSDKVPPSSDPKSLVVESKLTQRMLRWLPLALAGHLLVGVPALVISLVVAYGTFVQAQATQRMLQASTWPFLAYDTSNYDPSGKRRIRLILTNNGVGPALLGPIELRYQGRVMHTPQEFLSACCGYKSGESIQLSTAPATNVALRPGDQITFFDMPENTLNARMMARLESERWKLQVRSCYCSIFEDCWTIEGIQARPRKVAQCPADWKVYKER